MRRMEIEDYLKQKEEDLDRSSRVIKDHRVFHFGYVPEQPLMRHSLCAAVRFPVGRVLPGLSGPPLRPAESSPGPAGLPR